MILVLAMALSVNTSGSWFGSALFARISPWMVRLITGAVFLVGSLLLLDAFWFYVTGDLFIPA